MAKNDMAKSLVVEKLKQAFGSDFLGEADKKYYVMSKEDGAPVQVAITLTCPKAPVDFNVAADAPIVSISDGMMDFSITAANSQPKPQVEVSQDEQENIRKMLERLGL